ncbi:MAG: phosphoribosylanthranilate isomerase [Wenzhouxiangellaceae bacterium]|nr:phosphoribosylanthranilate isomerase [Wenzhouxiangellaceae bacterium]
MAHVRVKFCGMTRRADIEHAAALGVEAIGLVFVERSPRAVTIEQAERLCRALPPWLSVVGLFMDAPAAAVESVLARVPLNWLQFHGSETPAYCRAFGRPWIKALPMASPGQVQYDRWNDASALLLDAHAAGELGGSGLSFDWSRAVFPQRPWILAGGLSPDNLSEALAAARPPAVDVSSGIESAPGIKSAEKMTVFMEILRNG